jgi:hypothetical protein
MQPAVAKDLRLEASNIGNRDHQLSAWCEALGCLAQCLARFRQVLQ